jgi:hypothetical protein
VYYKLFTDLIDERHCFQGFIGMNLKDLRLITAEDNLNTKIVLTLQGVNPSVHSNTRLRGIFKAIILIIKHHQLLLGLNTHKALPSTSN